MGAAHRHCWNCGAEEPAEAELCEHCSKPLTGPPSHVTPLPPPPGVPQPAPSPPVISWDYTFPLLNNRSVLLEFAKLLFFSYLAIVLLMGSLFLAQGELDELPPLLLLFAYCLAGFAVLFLLIWLVFFPARRPRHFTVGPDRVCVTMTGGRAGLGARIAVTAGRFTQSPTQIEVAWEDVRRVREYPRRGRITLSNGWRTVLRLHCLPANYAAVATAVRQYAAAGAQRRRAT